MSIHNSNDLNAMFTRIHMYVGMYGQVWREYSLYDYESRVWRSHLPDKSTNLKFIALSGKWHLDLIGLERQTQREVHLEGAWKQYHALTPSHVRKCVYRRVCKTGMVVLALKVWALIKLLILPDYALSPIQKKRSPRHSCSINKR